MLRLIGHSQIRLTQCGSTNDEAWRALAQGAADGLVIRADAQTQGRGQAGRSWWMPPGQSVALSLCLRPRQLTARDAWLLNAVASLAVAHVAQWAGVPSDALRVKWPNDVLAHGRKLAGILAETQVQGPWVQAAVLGVGLNVLTCDFPGELAERATSLNLAREAKAEAAGTQPADLTLDIVTSQLLDAFDVQYRRLSLGQAAALWADYEARLHRRGHWALYATHPDAERFEGWLEGLAADGRLRLRTRAGDVRLYGATELYYA